MFLIASFKSSSSFPYLGSLAPGEFSLLSPCILVFLMVDHSFVRLSYPSVSIFFVHLCHLLSLMGGSRPEVRPFVWGEGGEDCSYKFILLFLHPLVYRLVGIVESLGMSILEEGIHLSELETDLSSGNESSLRDYFVISAF